VGPLKVGWQWSPRGTGKRSKANTLINIGKPFIPRVFFGPTGCFGFDLECFLSFFTLIFGGWVLFGGFTTFEGFELFLSMSEFFFKSFFSGCCRGPGGFGGAGFFRELEIGIMVVGVDLEFSLFLLKLFSDLFVLFLEFL
jgi:hypothetical protein